MNDFKHEIISPQLVEDEIKNAYLDYAMSVIVGRALPDVRDGLKPVHRRVLHCMNQLGIHWNKAYKKSAKTVGDTLGRYHPHGEGAVYDAIVRMAQDFSMRYPLIDGHGNFGSVDGDSAASMRYTEIRLFKLSGRLLDDIECDTVDFIPNFDNSEEEPTVLPARYPNLLVNGSSGIAVGMATNIPPHNIVEVINGTIELIDRPDATLVDIMEHISGPDFPTAAFINGKSGIIQAYETGRGKIQLSAKMEIETNSKTNRQTIAVTEIPFQVNKAKLLYNIGQLVKDKKLEGIQTLRDESDRHGMRIAIEIKRGENAEVVRNNLLKQTALQTVFGINMVCLHGGVPKCMPLLDILNAFITHRREVVTRRTLYLLAKAKNKAHILEGLAVAISYLDEVIEIIKSSPTPQEAKKTLINKGWKIDLSQLVFSYLDLTKIEEISDQYGVKDGHYYLSQQQAQAILDLRLHRLTGLERDKILADHAAIIEQIKGYIAILSSYEKLMALIKEELIEVRDQFGDERRTEILESYQEIDNEDLIPNQQVVVTLTQEGYAKTQPVENYSAQRRGGRGKSASAIKEEDVIKFLSVASTHDTMLCFTTKGRLFWLKVYRLPMSSRGSRGRPLVNYLKLLSDESISAILCVSDLNSEECVVMSTKQGTIKKTPLSAFSKPRNSGVNAINLDDGDALIGVDLVKENDQIMLFTNHGKVNRFCCSELRPIGRNARGVRGIKLHKDQTVISMIVVSDKAQILTVTNNGFGKRTNLKLFRETSRGGMGVMSMRLTDKTGHVIGAIAVDKSEEILLLTAGGTMVRLKVNEISLIGRQTQGVKLINLSENEQLVALQAVSEPVGVDENLELE